MRENCGIIILFATIEGQFDVTYWIREEMSQAQGPVIEQVVVTDGIMGWGEGLEAKIAQGDLVPSGEGDKRREKRL